MKTLSVVLATFNEEKNLGGCLDSIKDIADEIVIVDGSSSDKTVEIAEKYKAKVKITTNKPNFHINKQMAIDMATKDWVLQLDGDEHVSPELKDEILKVLNQSATSHEPRVSCNGYWMPRKNLFLGRFLLKGGQYPDYTLRLYRNGKGKLPQKDVHEQAEVSGKVGYLKAALLHYPYKNFSHYLKKWNMYNNLFAAQISKEQEKKNIFEKLFYAFTYLVAKPGHWFLTTYFRHKGFMDSWQGFTFSLFSALRFPASYLKYLGIYKISIFLIILLSFVLRFWDFPMRWGLGGDDARDVMIALEAIKRFDLPLVGSFSSAGPFVFGPLFYWFIMASFIVLPFAINAPWITMALLSVFTVGIFIYLGNLIGGKRLALIIGIFTATSPQLVVRSLILGQHSFIPIFTVLLILSFVLLWQKKKTIFAFFMGISLGIAFSMHYQAFNLFIFFPILFFVKSLNIKEKFLSLFLMIVGFIIPSLPLFYWDYNQGFANIRNFLDYILIGQERIYVPNSWRLFIFKYFPDYWSFVTGRFLPLSTITIFLTAVLFAVASWKRKINPIIFVLGIVFFIFAFISRYYRGERSESYLLYFLPFIIIFTSWTIERIIASDLFEKIDKRFKKFSFILGVILFSIILIGNTIASRNMLIFNNGVSHLREVSEILSKKYPSQKFALYDLDYRMYTATSGLSYIMETQGKLDKGGIPLGVSCFGKNCPPKGNVVVTVRGYPVYDLREYKTKRKLRWVKIDQESVYDDLIGWLNKNQLKSTFSLKNYIIDKLGLKIEG